MTVGLLAMKTLGTMRKAGVEELKVWRCPVCKRLCRVIGPGQVKMRRGKCGEIHVFGSEEPEE